MKNYKKNMKIDRSIIEKENLQPAPGKHPEASVVIVTYNTDEKLLFENLKALSNQSAANFEVFVVDNSDRKNLEPTASHFPINYIKLSRNTGPSIGRNVGIDYARGEIIIFLDDDAIPDKEFVEQHVKAHKTYDIAGLRGKALPRTKTVYNYLVKTYDLGDKVFPQYINLEGNSSVKKNILNQIGGFSSQITGGGGHEGCELSYRIINHLNDRNKLIYYPGPVIYHDYCGSFFKYFRKMKRHDDYLKQLTEEDPELSRFRASYSRPQNITTVNRQSFFIKLKLKLIRKSISGLLKINEMFSRIFHGSGGTSIYNL